MAVQISGNDITVPRDGTFSRNVSIAGTLTYEDVTNVDSIGLVTARNGIEVGASPGVAASISVDGNAIFSGIVTATSFVGDKLSLGDNERVALGIGSDLSLLHDGSQSYIINSTGNLDIRTGSNSSDSIDIQSSNGGENMAKFIPGGAVELYHNNNKKLETASGGVTVTGTVAATSYTGDGSSLTGVNAISVAQQFRLASNQAGSSSAGTVLTNWEESDTDYQRIGSGAWS